MARECRLCDRLTSAVGRVPGRDSESYAFPRIARAVWVLVTGWLVCAEHPADVSGSASVWCECRRRISFLHLEARRVLPLRLLAGDVVVPPLLVTCDGAARVFSRKVVDEREQRSDAQPLVLGRAQHGTEERGAALRRGAGSSDSSRPQSRHSFVSVAISVVAYIRRRTQKRAVRTSASPGLCWCSRRSWRSPARRCSRSSGSGRGSSLCVCVKTCSGSGWLAGRTACCGVSCGGGCRAAASRPQKAGSWRDEQLGSALMGGTFTAASCLLRALFRSF